MARQIITAVDKGHYYAHFGINRKLVNLYGVRESDVVDLEVWESDNQEDRIQGRDADYWGFLDMSLGKFTFIYPSKVQLKICSPDFWESAIEAGMGKVVRVEVRKI